MSVISVGYTLRLSDLFTMHILRVSFIVQENMRAEKAKDVTKSFTAQDVSRKASKVDLLACFAISPMNSSGNEGTASIVDEFENFLECYRVCDQSRECDGWKQTC